MDITNFIRDGVTYPIGDAKSRESIATAFDSTASYSAGDYVMYDGTLYKFTSSHSGNWDSTHVEATCVTDELGGGDGGNAQVMYHYEQPVNTATNAEIFRITDSKINTDTVVLECTFADPSYITSDVTWTSYEGYIAFTGTCTTATTANVTMAYKTENSVSDRLLTLLWENPNPTNNFASQTISNLDFSLYDFFVVKTLTSNYSDAYEDLKDYVIVQKNITRTINEPLGALANTDGSNKQFKSRNILITNTSITFSDSYARQWNTTSANNGTVDNSSNIPLAIYGVSKYSKIAIEKTKITHLSKYSGASESQTFDGSDIPDGVYLLYIGQYGYNANAALYTVAFWGDTCGLCALVPRTTHYNITTNGRSFTVAPASSSVNYFESHLFLMYSQ